MTKMNQKGFTLIELLAVITIMGILMLVAIPAVQRIITNARRDTFAHTAKNYIEAIKNSVVADELSCCHDDAFCTRKPISELNSGTAAEPSYYYYYFRSDENSGQDLMEQGGKSAFGNIDVRGVIRIGKYIENSHAKYNYAITMVDGRHGIGTLQTSAEFVEEKDINRGSVDLNDKKFNNIAGEGNLDTTKKRNLCGLTS